MTILAGGVGSRFWPVSTPDRPKQLLPLASERPLIVDTMERASALTDRDRIRILAGSHLVEPMRRALPELPESIFLVEPRARGTAPVLVWAAWTLLQKDPDAILVSLHSDHVVDPPGAFVATVLRAARVARDHRRLMTVAIPPDRPEVGYGYIQPGDEIGEGFDVVAFHEKPDRETAARYVDDGYLWNSGIFVWRARDFLDEVRAHAPEIGDLLVHLDEGEPEKFFQEAPKISVDEAVLERSSRVAAVEADFRWDDVGSWEALARNRSPGPDGNVVQGRARFVDSRDNIVYSEEKPVVLFGVDDLVVVRTGDVTLVTRRDRAPRLKELLDELPEELRNP
ncbi:MAG: sugar phosphate nucleotidyltransferase [Longimicrobiales bacterium]|nr:sugar phosphate nucleotidyltransferase [Longimicrobiales bacterium]